MYTGVVKSPVRWDEEHVARTTQELSTRRQIWSRWTRSEQISITGWQLCEVIVCISPSGSCHLNTFFVRIAHSFGTSCQLLHKPLFDRTASNDHWRRSCFLELASCCRSQHLWGIFSGCEPRGIAKSITLTFTYTICLNSIIIRSTCISPEKSLPGGLI